MKTELIKFLNYLEKCELFTDDLSEDSKENLVLNFIHSAQRENSNVSDNVDEKIIRKCEYSKENGSCTRYDFCPYETNPDVFCNEIRIKNYSS